MAKNKDQTGNDEVGQQVSMLRFTGLDMTSSRSGANRLLSLLDLEKQDILRLSKGFGGSNVMDMESEIGRASCRERV